MKCPKCGCENDDDYKFCRKCGEPRKNKLNKSNPFDSSKIKFDSLGGSSSGNSIFNKKTIILGIAIIVIVAIIAMGVNSLNIGGIEPGNEHIINIDQSKEDVDGNIKYYLSFTLTNAPKQANTYYVKVTWYNDAGEDVGSYSGSLEYDSIDEDNTMDIYTATKIPNNISVSKAMIEVTDNQGQLVTSTSTKITAY